MTPRRNTSIMVVSSQIHRAASKMKVVVKDRVAPKWVALANR